MEPASGPSQGPESYELRVHLDALKRERCELELFVGEFVHEGHQPLTVAQNYLSVALRRLAAVTARPDAPTSPASEVPPSLVPSQIRADLELIQAELDRLQHQFNQVRVHLRSMKRPSEPAWILPAVRAAQDRLILSGIVDGINLGLDLPEKDVRLQVSGCRVEMVVECLLRNACEAVRGSRPARPSGKKRSAPSLGTVAVAVRYQRDRVLLEVSDDGPGIAAEIRDQVTRPFFTTKSSGLGLGLSYCRSVVERGNGCLRLDESPSGGAAITAEFLLFED